MIFFAHAFDLKLVETRFFPAHQVPSEFQIAIHAPESGLKHTLTKVLPLPAFDPCAQESYSK